jgi:hypothetical protein
MKVPLVAILLALLAAVEISNSWWSGRKQSFPKSLDLPKWFFPFFRYRTGTITKQLLETALQENTKKDGS